MLRWSLAFFLVAIVAGILGFGGIASGASEIARVLFFIFLVVFLISLSWELAAGRRPRLPPL